MTATVIAAVAVIGIAVVVVRRGDNRLDPTPAAATIADVAEQAGPPARTTSAPSTTSTSPAPLVERPVREPQTTPSPNVAVTPRPAGPAASPELRDLVKRLGQLDAASGPLTPERAQEWTENLNQLVRSGAAGVLAIQEYLNGNANVDFGAWGLQNVGYASARGALIGALIQMGSGEAREALVATLGTTLDPADVGAIASGLQQLAPDQYRSHAVEAARRLLTSADRPGVQGKDMAPVFDVLQHLGGPSALPELEQAVARWDFYAPITLAQMPDGAGIPSLIRVAQGEVGAGRAVRPMAQQMLTQLALDHPDARAALIDQARGGAVDSSGWFSVSLALEGNRYYLPNAAQRDPRIPTSGPGVQHMLAHNQKFDLVNLPGALNADAIGQRTALIDDLLSVTQDPAAVRNLERARATLAKQGAAAGSTAAPPP